MRTTQTLASNVTRKRTTLDVGAVLKYFPTGQGEVNYSLMLSLGCLLVNKSMVNSEMPRNTFAVSNLLYFFYLACNA